MMTMRYSTAALFLALLGWGCGGEGGGEWTGTVTDSAGVTLVQNTTEGIWGPGDAWTLEEEVRIGSLEGEPEYQFGAVG